MGIDYKQYSCYTGSPDFVNFTPTEKHSNDFRFVYLNVKGKNSICARRCLSLSSSKIISVEKAGENTLLKTENFTVKYENALKYEEIKIINEKPEIVFGDDNIYALIERVDDLNESFELGLYTKLELDDFVHDQFALFYFCQKRWLPKYRTTLYAAEPFFRIMETDYLESEYLFM